MNRSQRRLIASKRGKKKGLDKAGTQLDSAMATLSQMGGLEEAAKSLTAAQEQMAETQKLLEAMVADNQTMADQIEALSMELVVQRTVTLQLLSRLAGDSITADAPPSMGALVREIEQDLRNKAMKAAEESSCEGT